MDDIVMTELEKIILDFLNKKLKSNFFIYKLDSEVDGLYLGYAYPIFDSKKFEDKKYLMVDKQKIRQYKIDLILSKKSS